MSQYSTGLSSVTNGSPTVTGTNTLWLANVSAGDSFTVAGDGVMYDVASVDSDTQVTLSVAYAGVTASGVVYAIGTGFTVPDSFPEMSQGDIETATIFTRAMRKIQSKFSALVSDIGGKAAIAGQTFTGDIAAPGITASKNGVVAEFDRVTTGGDIAQFKHDGTLVGTIGERQGRVYIHSPYLGGSGLRLGDDKFIPCNDDGTDRDKDIDIGRDGARFKDFYLAGNAFLGDTALVGKADDNNTDTGITLNPVGYLRVVSSNAQGIQLNRLNSTGEIVRLQNDGTTVGTISVTGSSTAYNTSSDYRLKTDVQPIIDATTTFKKLKPVNFEWIADGTRVDGFLAHELQEVIPEAATGTKDAMQDEQYELSPAVFNSEGVETEPAVTAVRSVPDMQGVDQSKLVPLLVATVQELLERIEALESPS